MAAPTFAEKARLALCQMSVGEDKEANIAEAERQIKLAKQEDKADLVLLPEMWNCPYSNDSFPVYAEELSDNKSPSLKMLQEVARSESVTIIGGSIPERCEGKLYNTCLVIGPDGTVLGKYSKTHLFDIDIPGKISFKESLTLTPGSQPLVVDTDKCRIGVGICYDIRFPELSQIYVNRSCQLLLFPGAFNMTTGPLHWQLLQQARAVDGQLFVATCSPARNPRSSYQAWGHSMAVGPFGEILASASHEPCITVADLDFGEVAQRRQNMPLEQQRRRDLYGLVDKTG